MTRLVALHTALFARIESIAFAVLPTLARFVFAAVLLGYYWNSALTKLGDGVFGFIRLSSGAYVQMFPKQMEAAGYDPSMLGLGYKLVALAGTWAEFILPLLLVIGLFTRLAALGMIGFVAVQSLTDIYGHNADADTIGHWFDRIADAHILDQRAFWVFVLVYLVFRGAGPVSVDRLVLERPAPRVQAASG
ncbi:DoxX family protein [Psychromarinibacter halotolerans]|uniref:DoxX family protein n=1 Tax=Psychromarinibacter halotolerans TaxID=1775175 RepID=A0ABV7GZ19_9RHOB|nr:DoxX family protein [Psychromarinibacter halotolerans]MDF0598699.1 DoxX family protein [Psychromarinibacter halotolerans]